MNHNPSKPYRLHRSQTDRKISGVCGGIAEYLNVESWMVRILFVIGLAATPIFFFGYFFLSWILKKKPIQLYGSPEEEVFWRDVATKPDQTLSGLRGKFRELELSVSRMEGFVASSEYELRRQFKDLEAR
jgi:phage shock protein C